MSTFDRLKELSGQNSKQPTIDQMNADLKQITEQYQVALESVKVGKQIDEGFFSSLKAAFQTASQLGKQGAGAVKDKIAKVAAPVITLYKDNKAQMELQALMKNLKSIIDKFDEISNSAPTLFKNDKQLALEMDYFRKVMTKMIQTLSSRLAIKEGLTTDAEIEKMMKEVWETPEIQENSEESQK